MDLEAPTFRTTHGLGTIAVLVSGILPWILPQHAWAAPWVRDFTGVVAGIFPVIGALSAQSPMPQLVATSLAFALASGCVVGLSFIAVYTIRVLLLGDAVVVQRFTTMAWQSRAVYVTIGTILFLMFDGDLYTAWMIDNGIMTRGIHVRHGGSYWLLGTFSGEGMRARSLENNGLLSFIPHAPYSLGALAATAVFEYVVMALAFWIMVIAARIIWLCMTAW